MLLFAPNPYTCVPPYFDRYMNCCIRTPCRVSNWCAWWNGNFTAVLYRTPKLTDMVETYLLMMMMIIIVYGISAESLHMHYFCLHSHLYYEPQFSGTSSRTSGSFVVSFPWCSALWLVKPLVDSQAWRTGCHCHDHNLPLIFCSLSNWSVEPDQLLERKHSMLAPNGDTLV
jgi:hypothetical protein